MAGIPLPYLVLVLVIVLMIWSTLRRPGSSA